jgi:serine/threonine protein kinase
MKNENYKTNKYKISKYKPRKYTIDKCLYKNDSISIYKALYCDQHVIIKHETHDLTLTKQKSIIKNEHKVLEHLREIDNIPKIIDSYSDCINNYIVMNYLGKDLDEILLYKKKFSLGFCAFFMTEGLSILQNIHNQNIFHCDIKPSNFIFNKKEYKIYLIDFSVAQPEQKCAYTLIGTPKFCSHHCHEHIPYAYRDDLISLGYVMLYFFLGFLPWQKSQLLEVSEPSYLHKIKNKKNELLDFLNNYKKQEIPEEIIIYFNYCFSLKPKCEIDYNMLCSLFIRIIKQCDYDKNALQADMNLENQTNSNSDNNEDDDNIISAV